MIRKCILFLVTMNKFQIALIMIYIVGLIHFNIEFSYDVLNSLQLLYEYKVISSESNDQFNPNLTFIKMRRKIKLHCQNHIVVLIYIIL